MRLKAWIGVAGLLFIFAALAQAADTEVSRLGRAQATVVCAGSRVQPTCAPGQVIAVHSASWGRADDVTCSNVPAGAFQKAEGRCSADITALVQQQCNGRRACEVPVEHELLPQVCAQTWKYATYQYTCVSAFEVAACEGTELSLQCQPGQEVIVNRAMWGSRSAAASGGAPIPACAQSANLAAANALGDCQVDVTAEAAAQCAHGQSSCRLELSALQFGAPCQGVTKFLEASYACRTLPISASLAVDFDASTKTVLVRGSQAKQHRAKVVVVGHGHRVEAVADTPKALGDASEQLALGGAANGLRRNFAEAHASAMRFHGDSGHIKLQPPVALNAARWTIDTWVQLPLKPLAPNAEGALASNLLEDADGTSPLAVSANAQQLGLFVPASDDAPQEPAKFHKVVSLAELAAGWHHVAVVLSESRLRYYVDGRYAGSLALEADPKSPAHVAVQNVALIGADFAGVLARVRVHAARALSNTELVEISSQFAPGAFTYTHAQPVYHEGRAIDANAPLFTAGVSGAEQLRSVYAFTALTPLPAGLHLDAYTGAITGTPTVAADYHVVIQADNSVGFAQADLTIRVQPVAPAKLAYAAAKAVYHPHVAIAPNAPSREGGRPTEYSVQPALPKGLTLDAQWGVIRGTPAAATPKAEYTITARNAAGSAQTQVSIAVLYPLSYPHAEYKLAYGHAAPAAALTPEARELLLHEAHHVEFRVAPQLPQGLSLNVKTGAISGTPVKTDKTPSKIRYTVVAQDAEGRVLAKTKVDLAVTAEAPSKMHFSHSTYVLYKGEELAANMIAPIWPSQSTTPSELHFTVEPSLPFARLGLHLDAKSGAVSGTPLEVTSVAAAFTVRAHDAFNAVVASAEFSVAVVDAVPGALAYDLTEVVYQVGKRIAPNRASCVGGGMATRFSVEPQLPAGLVLSEYDGTISGTPTMPIKRARYVVTAASTGGRVQLPLHISVSPKQEAPLHFVPLMFAPKVAMQCAQCSASCAAHSPRHVRRARSATQPHHSFVKTVITEGAKHQSTASSSTHAAKSAKMDGLHLIAVDSQVEGMSLLEVAAADGDESLSAAETVAWETDELNTLAQTHFGVATYAELSREQREHLHVLRRRSTGAERALEACECSGCTSTIRNLLAATGRLVSDDALASLKVNQLDSTPVTELSFTYHAGLGGRLSATGKLTTQGLASTVNIRAAQSGEFESEVIDVSGLVHSEHNRNRNRVLLELSEEQQQQLNGELDLSTIELKPVSRQSVLDGISLEPVAAVAAAAAAPKAAAPKPAAVNPLEGITLDKVVITDPILEGITLDRVSTARLPSVSAELPKSKAWVPPTHNVAKVRVTPFVALIEVTHAVADDAQAFDAQKVLGAQMGIGPQMAAANLGDVFDRGFGLTSLWASRYVDADAEPFFATPFLQSLPEGRRAIAAGLDVRATVTLRASTQQPIVRVLIDDAGADAKSIAAHNARLHVQLTFAPQNGGSWRAVIGAPTPLARYAPHPQLVLRDARIVFGRRSTTLPARRIATNAQNEVWAAQAGVLVTAAPTETRHDREVDPLYLGVSGMATLPVSETLTMDFHALVSLDRVDESHRLMVVSLASSLTWMHVYHQPRLQLSDLRATFIAPTAGEAAWQQPLQQLPPLPALVATSTFGYGNPFSPAYMVGAAFLSFEHGMPSALVPSTATQRPSVFSLFSRVMPHFTKNFAQALAGDFFESLPTALASGWVVQPGTLAASFAEFEATAAKPELTQAGQSFANGLRFTADVANFFGLRHETAKLSALVRQEFEGEVGTAVVEHTQVPKDHTSLFASKRVHLDVNVSAPVFSLGALRLTRSSQQTRDGPSFRFVFDAQAVEAASIEGMPMPNKKVFIHAFSGAASAASKVWGEDAEVELALSGSHIDAFVHVPLHGSSSGLSALLHAQADAVPATLQPASPFRYVARLDASKRLLPRVHARVQNWVDSLDANVHSLTTRVRELRHQLEHFEGEAGCVPAQMCSAQCGSFDVNAANQAKQGGVMFDATNARTHGVPLKPASSKKHQQQGARLLESESRLTALPHRGKHGKKPNRKMFVAASAAQHLAAAANGQTNSAAHAQLEFQVALEARSFGGAHVRNAFDRLSARRVRAHLNKVGRSMKHAVQQQSERLAAFWRSGQRNLAGSAFFVADQIVEGNCRAAALDAPKCIAQCANDADADAMLKELLALSAELAAARAELKAVLAALGSRPHSRSAFDVVLEFAAPSLHVEHLPASVDLTATLLVPGHSSSFKIAAVNLRDPQAMLQTLTDAVASELQCTLISQLKLKVLGNAPTQCAAVLSRQSRQPHTCARPGFVAAPRELEGLLFDPVRRQLLTHEPLPSEPVLPSRPDVGVFYSRGQHTCPASLPKSCDEAADSFRARYPQLARGLSGVHAKYVYAFYLNAPARFGLQWLGQSCEPCSAVDGLTPLVSKAQYLPVTCLPSLVPTHEMTAEPVGDGSQTKVTVSNGAFTVSIDGADAEDDGQQAPKVQHAVGADARMSAVRVSEGGRIRFAPAIALPAAGSSSGYTFDAQIRLPLAASQHYQVLLGGPREQLVVADLAGHRLGMLDASNRFVLLEGYSLSEATPGWHRLTVVGASGVQTFYLDGERIGQMDGQAQGPWNTVGNWARATPLNRQWQGDIGSVRYYNYQMNEEQVALL